MSRRLNRTGVCYTPRPIREEDLRLMRRIDERPGYQRLLRAAQHREYDGIVTHELCYPSCLRTSIFS
jgi:hypothetical protein